MPTKRKKRRIKGYCRICKKYGKLSNDHIPPKSCGNKMPVDIFLLSSDDKQNNQKGYKKSMSQNGLKFPTICGQCNSVLGRRYDPEMARVYNDALEDYKRKIITPSQNINIDAGLFLRAVVGHFLAIPVTDDVFTEIKSPPILAPFPDALSDYYLEKNDALVGIDVYYWYYPFNTIRIVPYSGFIDISLKDSDIYGAAFKFFPLAIWLVDDNSKRKPVNIPKLARHTGNVDLYLQHLKLIPEKFPEMPSDNGICLTSNLRHTEPR